MRLIAVHHSSQFPGANLVKPPGLAKKQNPELPGGDPEHGLLAISVRALTDIRKHEGIA